MNVGFEVPLDRSGRNPGRGTGVIHCWGDRRCSLRCRRGRLHCQVCRRCSLHHCWGAHRRQGVHRCSLRHR
jgi:hypothetical protein